MHVFAGVVSFNVASAVAVAAISAAAGVPVVACIPVVSAWRFLAATTTTAPAGVLDPRDLAVVYVFAAP